MTSALLRKVLCCAAVGCGLIGSCGGVARAQAQAACGTNGTRVTGTRWDAVLRKGFEYRQECAHPEWPVRLAAVGSVAEVKIGGDARAAAMQVAVAVEAVAVTAGAPVRLWMQDDMVRIEMNGVAERSARKGEQVTVQVTHQSDENGLSVERVAGIVRGPGEVEMER